MLKRIQSDSAWDIPGRDNLSAAREFPGARPMHANRAMSIKHAPYVKLGGSAMLPEPGRTLAPQDDTYGERDWDGVIVLCAATSFTAVKAADHHMAEHLSRLAPVLYVDPPLSPLTPCRNRSEAQALHGPRFRLQAPGLARLTPVVQPGPSRPALTPLTAVLARRYLRRAAARFRGRVHAVISVWPQYPVFGSCGEDVRVYWSQDDFVGGAGLMGLNAKHLETRERGIAADADFVAAVSPVLAQTWRDRGAEALFIPNGADLSSFAEVDRAPCPTDVRLPGPTVGLIGHINARIDLRLLEVIADRGRSLLLVGPKDPAFEPERFGGLLRRPNVCWVGPKPFELLPGYLRLIDVGIVPYLDSVFNRGSFPMKTLEYLAAGRAVVAADLPSIRWLATDLVALATGPAAFADAVDGALDEVRSPAMMARRRAFASRHDWARRAADMHAAILDRRGQHSGQARAGLS